MTEKSTEGKEEISFNEFKAWLTGLIRGKRGQLPDLEDWKHIKVMMDKVAPEVTFLPNPITPVEDLLNPWTLPRTVPYQPYVGTPMWNDCTGYGGISPAGAVSVNGLTATSGVPGANQVSVSYGDMKIEDLPAALGDITSSTYSVNLNPSQELNIAIDDLIKTQENAKA